ncbi:class I SAM-dependent methyltransferase [Flavobacteriaceae bacterium]|jgi:2-polyprenyl-3-methyl-5-hydroxy-6-metoxy-1,4-benzoquinol methylase|nr:class I SAM-dependent methyltransferase [Flavobacteriaceae bacterium]MDB4560165.1 class I SAM-dependent methyltransferase [Flavobacteriaceae bacterium]MDC0652463.1 class I SAM-dependent methyltransferase [Flavobacteriaceae bacterium]
MSQKTDFFKNLKPYLNCKDHTVSGEEYSVMFNEEYKMLVTSPVPKNLFNYYKSKNYISHTDSKKTFFDKAYQVVKKITLKHKLRLINESLRTQNSMYRPEKNILDVGAGTGEFLKVCKNNSWKVFGTEPNNDARTIAVKKGIVLERDISKFSNQKFEIITLWHVLEHVENLSEYISNLNTMLSDCGRLIIAVPNFNSDDAKYYKEFWAAFDVPRHLWHFSQQSIHRLFLKENMLVEKTIPMKFDSYYVSLLSEKYKNGKSNFMSALYRGFVSNWKARASSEYSSLIFVIKKQE